MSQYPCEVDAIRAIQAKSDRTKMELSADYTDYADYSLRLQMAGELRISIARVAFSLVLRVTGAANRNLRNLCNLRIFKFLGRKTKMFNNSGIKGLHCSEVHASRDRSLGGIASPSGSCRIVSGSERVSRSRDWNASKS